MDEEKNPPGPGDAEIKKEFKRTLEEEEEEDVKCAKMMKSLSGTSSSLPTLQTPALVKEEVDTQTESGSVKEIGDELLRNEPDNYPSYICWMPDSDTPLKLTHHEYKPLQKIIRVLHFEDHIEVFKKSAFIPSTITEEKHSSMENKPIEGIWFDVIRTDRIEHNWFGNISYEVDFESFLRTFKPKFYFIEVVEFRSSSASRLLLTTQTFSDEVMNNPYDPYQEGGPLYIDGRGYNFYLDEIRRYDEETNDFPPELEMFIVLSPDEYKGLYDMCKKIAVEHSEVNVDELHKCKKYRSRGLKIECPSPWTIEECQRHLDKLRRGEFVKDELVKN